MLRISFTNFADNGSKIGWTSVCSAFITTTRRNILLASVGDLFSMIRHSLAVEKRDKVQFLMNSINWPACHCMGLHSSNGRVLQRDRRGHGFESRWSPEILFCGLISQLLKFAIQLRWSHLHFICISEVHNSPHSKVQFWIILDQNYKLRFREHSNTLGILHNWRLLIGNRRFQPT